MTVAIEIEGLEKGMQTFEERFVIVKAKSQDDAYLKMEKQKKSYGKPYLNSDGRQVRWRIESFDDCYETGVNKLSEFNNPEGILRSGSSGIIRLPIEQKGVMLVPQNAIFEVQGKQTLYVVGKDNKVKSRIVTTNGTSELNFIVTDGLQEGEVVVIEGASKLKDDMEIVPQEKQQAPAEANAQAPVAKDTVQTTPAKK